MIDARVMEQRRLNKSATGIETPKVFLDRFPKLNRDKADRHFRRYLDVVLAELLPRLPFLRDGETHMSTHGLFERCGSFQHDNARYHVWNEFKDIYQLVQIVATGNNLKITNHPAEKNSRVRVVNERILTMLLEEQTPAAVYDHFFGDIPDDEISQVVPINMDNLRRYIGNTEYELTKADNQNHRDTLQRNLWQARLVEKIGQHTENEYDAAVLPMSPRPSAFGRTYYRGLNIQNLSKQVRSAVIGHHYQYDMNAAAFATKLLIYGAINGSDNAIAGTRLGSWTREYLADKDGVRRRLARDAFQGINVSEDAAIKAIKLALTAIGFGARTSGKTWMTKEGQFEGTAISEIIKAPEARERFLADRWVRDFLDEQKVIEDAILADAETKDDYEAMCQAVRGNNGVNGKVTRAGKLAYIYQHWETHLMDEAVAVLAAHGIAPVARIHDAFIVTNKLSQRVLDEISATWGLRDYLGMSCDEVREWVEPAFKRALDCQDTAIAEHRDFIQREEARAQKSVLLKRIDAVREVAR